MQIHHSHRATAGGACRLALAAAALIAVACASPAPAPLPPAGVPAAARPAAAHGPKKTVAVARFDAHGAFLARYGSYDLGGGLAAQLASELERSGRFVVVERAELGSVLREQELALSGLSAPQTSPRAGQLVGAQLLVRGSVTEFSESDSGSGFRVGGPISSGFGSALGTRSRKGHVSIDLRVIDTTSGRLVTTHTVDRELRATSLALEGVTRSGTTVGYDGFERSPLGKATREAIAEAVRALGAELAAVPWNAQVAKVSGGRVYVNAGADANLAEGASLGVYRVVDRVLDPTTGELLGLEEQRIGTLTIGNVHPRYATGTYAGSQRPRVGDLLRYGASGA
jgi:curli biogenesis system outer membrane secretion channel CsgG